MSFCTGPIPTVALTLAERKATHRQSSQLLRRQWHSGQGATAGSDYGYGLGRCSGRSLANQRFKAVETKDEGINNKCQTRRCNAPLP